MSHFSEGFFSSITALLRKICQGASFYGDLFPAAQSHTNLCNGVEIVCSNAPVSNQIRDFLPRWSAHNHHLCRLLVSSQLLLSFLLLLLLALWIADASNALLRCSRLWHWCDMVVPHVSSPVEKKPEDLLLSLVIRDTNCFDGSNISCLSTESSSSKPRDGTISFELLHDPMHTASNLLSKQKNRASFKSTIDGVEEMMELS